jgi:Cytochrome P450
MRDHLTYGGGRRICCGIHVAERSLFLVLARLLWGFDLVLAKDENGDDIPVDFSISGLMPGATSVARPFKCSIIVRSLKREAIFRREWDEAQKDGIQFEDINFAKLVGT